ncbi:MAG: hypothetical protein LBB10_00740 [Bifidobacteriaceae bacterium]|jgi:hypothetical protein|nr:hypothetical protein [Bifidobacteriaceae bacterium]
MRAEVFENLFLNGQNNPYLPNLDNEKLELDASIINSEAVSSNIDNKKCAKLYNAFFKGQYRNLEQAFNYEKSFRVRTLPGVVSFEKKFYHLPTLFIALKVAKCITDKKKIIVNFTRKTNLSLLVSYLKQLGCSITDNKSFGDICVFRKSDSGANYYRKWFSVLHNKSLAVIGLAKVAFAPLKDFDCAILVDEINAEATSKSGKYNPENNNIAPRAASENKQLISISNLFLSSKSEIGKLLQEADEIKLSENANLPNIINPREDGAADWVKNTRLPALAFSALQSVSKKAPALVIAPTKLGKKGVETTFQWFKRAFLDTDILVSTRGEGRTLIKTVDKNPKIVISTLGADPAPKEGWGVIIILDALDYLNFSNTVSKQIINSWMSAISHIKMDIGKSDTEAPVFIIGSIPETIIDDLKNWNTNLLDARDKLNASTLSDAFTQLREDI